ncbi:MAG: glycoside hydrolase family 3 protein [Acidobacteria bacterium]|nr:glycoside hydrolase family 3 protein [Acidobacteriota bacterium]
MSAGDFVFAGIPGPRLDGATAALLAASRPGGVVLFGRNLRGAGQVLDLVAGLRRLLPDAVLAVDAEGGRVDRLGALIGPAPAASLLARRPPAAARRAGRCIAQALRLFDVDLDLAPVVDLDRGETGNALDGRYLGVRDPAVTQRAREFLRGLHGGGVGGCLKHFPGLGAAGEDTHDRPATVRLGAAALAPHLKPFEALLPLAGAAMVAHAVYPALDPKERPASLSPPVIEELLRGELGFDGLVLSDDLEMQALAPWGDLPVRAEAAFAAGCDVVLACATLAALPEIVARLARPRHARRRREAARRLAACRQRLRTLRWASDSVSLLQDPQARTARLGAVREDLASLSRDLAG